MKHRVRKGDVTYAKTMINWVVCGRSLKDGGNQTL